MTLDFTVIFGLIHVAIVIGVAVYLLVLFTRFVDAHRRGADALEIIARKFSGSGER